MYNTHRFLIRKLCLHLGAFYARKQKFVKQQDRASNNRTQTEHRRAQLLLILKFIFSLFVGKNFFPPLFFLNFFLDHPFFHSFERQSNSNCVSDKKKQKKKTWSLKWQSNINCVYDQKTLLSLKWVNIDVLHDKLLTLIGVFTEVRISVQEWHLKGVYF